MKLPDTDNTSIQEKLKQFFLKMNGKAGILRKIRNNILKNVQFYENILHI